MNKKLIKGDKDILWMRQAFTLACNAEASNEVPVGALLVRDDKIIGRGWNRPITNHDPSAHAEIQALRDAGQQVGNYRFPGAALYCTLEPCPMCAGAIVQARLALVVYGAADIKGGACGSVFNLLPSDTRFNHRTECYGGILAGECGELLRKFFRYRRTNSNNASLCTSFSNKHMNKPFEALLFDVDGTLADTERDGHRVAFNRTFAEFDLDWCWSIDLYGQLLNVAGGKERLYHFIATMHPLIPEIPDLDEFITKLHTRKTQIYNDILSNNTIPLRPGIARLLREARADGIKLAIVTTTSLENVFGLLRNTLGAESINWFDVIAAGTQVAAKKPAPDIYLQALQQLGVEPTACVAVEDSAIGLQAAKNAEIATVIITVTDYTRKQNFTAATLVLENLDDPTAPCQTLTNSCKTAEYVTIDTIRQLHYNNWIANSVKLE